MPYYVYVIELDDEVGPRQDPDLPSVYVGQSFVTPEERFRQHKVGYRASKYVERYGLWLRRRLYSRYNPIATRHEAEELERELAGRLRRKGYAVYGGH